MSNPVFRAARVLWDYHRLGMEPEAVDGILVFGSNDLRVAEHAAELFHRKLAPWVLFSGARGRMTQGWQVTEAEAMAQVARDRGVPESAILMEPCATNTGENIRFSRELLERHGLRIGKAIVVQKPYMERRTFAALEVQWPEVMFRTSSPEISFEDYVKSPLKVEMVIEAMVGDFQRILDYPALGFASKQQVPDEVQRAYEFLLERGFNGQMR